MTLHSVLIEIVLAGVKGIERRYLLARYGYGVIWQIDSLMQLGLVLRSHCDLRYFATMERGTYSRNQTSNFRKCFAGGEGL
jgi:hypothetical protein